jgi:hypothetical protein
MEAIDGYTVQAAKSYLRKANFPRQIVDGARWRRVTATLRREKPSKQV